MSSNDVSTVSCIRSVSGSIGRWKPGRSASEPRQSGPFATPKIRLRVVFGTLRGDRDLVADERVDERGLADVRAPGDGDEPALHRAVPASAMDESDATVGHPSPPPGFSLSPKPVHVGDGSGSRT